MKSPKSISSVFLSVMIVCPILGIALGFDPQELATFPTEREVAWRFTNYLASDQHCSSVSDGPRVILSGFGLWSGQPHNLSGAVIDGLASESATANRSGALSRGEDVRIVNRKLRLQNGQEISACLILVSVMWDFAGAVMANEMSHFQPAAVVMTGISSKAYLETGAFNFAEFTPGYKYDGTPDPDNIPVDRIILRTPQAPSMLRMNWNAPKLGARIKPILDGLGINLTVAKQARITNEYICNNMSYLALAAAKNLPLNLAGSRIVFTPNVQSEPKVGFFHFPNVISNDRRFEHDYSRALLALVEGMLADE